MIIAYRSMIDSDRPKSKRNKNRNTAGNARQHRTI